MGESTPHWGTYGFRYAEAPPEMPICSLFAVGHEVERDMAYDWQGLVRSDGPLLLFQYTIAGEGAVDIDGHSYRVGPGQAFLVEIPGNHRYYLPVDHSSWEFYFLLIRPRVIAPLWSEIKSKLGPVPYLPAASGPVRSLQLLFEDAHAGRISDAYVAAAGIYRWMAELGRFAAAHGREQADWPGSVQAAAALIEQHHAAMMNQEQLAGQLGLSKFHLLRIFTRYVGMTPNDYLNRVRIERAVTLLRQTDWSIERIGAAVGYSSGSYFIKVFRKLTGQTPGHFRLGEGPLSYSRFFFD